VTDIYRAYVKLHELLTPYITEHAEIASSTGMPLMRHMVLHWQDDERVYSINDQYMFGDAFLVAPVLTNAKSRNIYLPEGEWLDLNTGETITVGKEGKEIKDYAAGISVLPVSFFTT
jgi:alpha-glucosidase (family GH31 glycosyl hydrolase)